MPEKEEGRLSHVARRVSTSAALILERWDARHKRRQLAQRQRLKRQDWTLLVSLILLSLFMVITVRNGHTDVLRPACELGLLTLSGYVVIQWWKRQDGE